jgi:hypothetical protein
VRFTLCRAKSLYVRVAGNVSPFWQARGLDGLAWLRDASVVLLWLVITLHSPIPETMRATDRYSYSLTAAISRSRAREAVQQ